MEIELEPIGFLVNSLGRNRAVLRYRPENNGRPAIEKYYADMFQILHYFSHDTTYDPTSPHPIGTDGNGVWENGEWSSAIAPKGEDCGPRQIRGYFGSVKVREGDTWKIRRDIMSGEGHPSYWESAKKSGVAIRVVWRDG